MEIKDIEKLAILAKIELNQKEKENLLKDLDGILAYVKQIESVEIKEKINIEEIEYLNKNIWREDKLTENKFPAEEIIKQFPDSQDNFLKVKKIL
jgi:aspartyl-tRNA(Asn)/glutamyl-tRNA(Gln) amidotransferase subunit C